VNRAARADGDDIDEDFPTAFAPARRIRLITLVRPRQASTYEPALAHLEAARQQMLEIPCLELVNGDGANGVAQLWIARPIWTGNHHAD